MPTKKLTALKVVEILGGRETLEELTGESLKSIYHWTGRSGTFPAQWYYAMQKALREHGITDPPPELWSMKKFKQLSPQSREAGKLRRKIAQLQATVKRLKQKKSRARRSRTRDLPLQSNEVSSQQ